MAAWIFLGIVVLAVMFFVGIYNSLVGLRNRVKNAWSQIDVQLKRRHDLIPNLVETAKGYMTHERETLSAITEARSRAMGAGSVAEKGVAETQLTQALSKFMALEGKEKNATRSNCQPTAPGSAMFPPALLKA